MNLSILVAEQVGLVILLAFALVNIPAFRRMLVVSNWQSQLGLWLIFATSTLR